MGITLGTPGGFPIDFGLSEAWGKTGNVLFGQPNILQQQSGEKALDYSQAQPAAQAIQSGGSINPATGAPNPVSTPTPQNKSGGSGSVPSNNAPQAPTPTGVDDVLRQAEDAYNAAMGYANTAESTIRGAQSGIEQNINNTAQNSLNDVNQSYTKSGTEIAGQEVSADKRFKNAISAARQALSESMMGGNQRFGRGSAISGALGEYATSQFNKTAGGLTDTLQTAMTTLSNAKQELETNYTNTKTKIGNWATEQINNARNELNNKLLEISNMRAGAVNEKANRNIQALSAYRSSIESVNNMAYQYQMQLYQQTQAAAQQWNAAATDLGKYFQTAQGAGDQQTSGISSLMSGATPVTASSVGTQQQTGLSGIADYVGNILGIKKNNQDLIQ